MKSAELSYAQAIFLAASERGKRDVLAQELSLLEPLIREHGCFFLNPGLPCARQIQTLRDCLRDQADPLTVEFLSLLCSRRYLRRLPIILNHFEILCREANGDLPVILRIPYEPDNALLDKLREALAEWSLYPSDRKECVRFVVEIDSSLIGGFTAECDGRVLDASLRTRLAQLIRS